MGCGASQGKYGAPKETEAKEHQILSLDAGYFVENHLGEGDFLTYYEPDEALSSKHGDFGRYIVARHRLTEQLAQVQPLAKSATSRAKFDELISVLRSVGHPNIAKLKEACEDAASYYLAFELCTGGTLLEAIEDRFAADWEECVHACTHSFHQILKTVEYMHLKHVCHRNLSTDAIVLHGKEKQFKKWQIVINDFANACRYTPGQKMTEVVDVRKGFSPPEFEKKIAYTNACDIYSCGAILCALLFGDPNPDLVDWKKNMSAEKGLILRMTSADAHRPSVEQCLADCFFNTMKEVSRGKEVSAQNLENMQRFCKSNKLKKLAIHISASHLSAPEVLRMKEMFELIDKDKSGVVSLAELKQAMQELMTTGGYRARAAIPQDVERLMEMLDVDGTATISYPEFIAAMTDRKHYTTDSTCLAVFRSFDRNGDGHINRAELSQALRSESFKDLDFNLFPAIEEVLASDKDGDGTLDFEEFKAMMKDTASSDVQKLTRDVGKRDLLKKKPQDSWAHKA